MSNKPTTDQSALNKFKIEANLSVFGTEVEIKPMENSEIGYRAGEGEDGISVTQTKLIEADLLDEDSEVREYLPDTTNIKTLIYDYKKQKVEIAVLAEFKPGKLTEKEIASLKSKKTEAGAATTAESKALKKSLEEMLTARKIAFTKTDKIDALITKLEGQKDDGFILNKYPKVFKLNSLYVYLNMEKDKNKKTDKPK